MKHCIVCSALLLLTTLVLAACGTASTQGPMAWLDQPLDGAKLPLEPQELTAHASDLDGVASLEFYVNDTLLVRAPASGGILADATVAWDPSRPGVYTISARATDSQGNVGSDSSVVVTVGELVGSPTPTPAEAAPGEVEISFTADRTELSPGECAILMWRVQGGEVALLNGESVPFSGESQTCPEETTSYTLAVYVGVGPPSPPVAERELVISVSGPLETPRPTQAAPTGTPRPPTPRPTSAAPTSTPLAPTATQPPVTRAVIAYFEANPGTINAGGCSTLSWDVHYATAAYLDGQGVIAPNTQQVCPATTTTYTLFATGTGGDDTRSVTVTVIQAPTPTPIITAIVVDSMPPYVSDLKAVPTSITADISPCTGQQTTVSVHAEDPSGVASVVAYWTLGSQSGQVNMTHQGAGIYKAVLGPFGVTGDLSISFVAWDTVGNSTPAYWLPYTVSVHSIC
jgi:hypothetical protein